MEAARHTQLTQANLQAGHRSLSTKRPAKSPKPRTWQTVYSHQTTMPYKEPGLLCKFLIFELQLCMYIMFRNTKSNH